MEAGGSQPDEELPAQVRATASALAQEMGRGLTERLLAVPGACTSPSVSCSCFWNFPAWGLLSQPPVFRWGLRQVLAREFWSP